MRQINLKSVAGWNNLTEKQLLKIARLMAQPKYEKSFVTKAFLAINGLRVKPGCLVTQTDDGRVFRSYIFQMNWKRKFTISANVFASMVKKMEWLEAEITLFRCLAKIGGYPASDHRLYNTTLEQFLFADNLYNAFISTGRATYLRQLVAVYYHRKGESFDSAKVEIRSHRFIFTKKERIYATYLWFTGVKRWIMDKYTFIFNSNEPERVTPPDEAILSLLSSLNQGDITRNETILKTHVHESLFQLNLMAEKAQQ